MKIYVVDEDSCVYHWVIAHSEADAIRLVRQHMETCAGEPVEGPEIGCEELLMDKELKLHCEEKAISHTVEDWLIIYEHNSKYLGCSEF